MHTTATTATAALQGLPSLASTATSPDALRRMSAGDPAAPAPTDAADAAPTVLGVRDPLLDAFDEDVDRREEQSLDGASGAASAVPEVILRQLPAGGRAGALCTVRASGNNTRVTVSGPHRSTVRCSAGQLKLKNRRRGSSYAAEGVGRRVAERLKAQQVRHLAVAFQGSSDAVTAVVRCLLQAGMRVHAVANVEPQRHGGTRLRKPAR